MPNYSVWEEGVRYVYYRIRVCVSAYGSYKRGGKGDVGHGWEDSLIHRPKLKPYSHAQFLGKGHVQNYRFLKLSC